METGLMRAFHGVMPLSCFSPKLTGIFKMKQKPIGNSLAFFFIPYFGFLLVSQKDINIH